MLRAYLAGPDVFLPNAVAHAAAKVAICARHGIEGCPPLNEDVQALLRMPASEAWRALFAKDVSMMAEADVIIANLTPFRGASADAGTLVELGYFLGRGRPAFGYSNTARLFDQRSRDQVAALPDPMPGIAVEGFGLPDNLMIPGAVMQVSGAPMLIPEDGIDRPFDSLEIFERCVALAAADQGSRRSSGSGERP